MLYFESKYIRRNLTQVNSIGVLEKINKIFANSITIRTEH